MTIEEAINKVLDERRNFAFSNKEVIEKVSKENNIDYYTAVKILTDNLTFQMSMMYL